MKSKKIINVCILIVTSFLIVTQALSQPDPPEPPVVIDHPEGRPVTIPAGREVHVRTPSGIEINLTISKGVALTISVISKDTIGVIPHDASLNIFVNISMDEDEADMSIDATISIPYSTSLLDKAGVEDENNLNLAYFDDVADKWRVISSGVNTIDNVVYAKTDHFSLWTIVAADADEAVNFPSITLVSLFLVCIVLIRKRKSE